MRFFIGDENGFLKSLRADLPPPGSDTTSNTPEPVILLKPTAEAGKSSAINRLAIRKIHEGELDELAVAQASGAVALHTVSDKDEIETIKEWKEPRMKASASYIGLGLAESGVYTCTTSGNLRMTPRSTSDSIKATLPMRLCDFQLSPNEKFFAYGGDEVDLSVWDAEAALSAPAPVSAVGDAAGESKKRKKPSSNDLLPGEVWRAKNLPNDNLQLRQPVHVSSLAFLDRSSTDKGPSHHLITGSRLGHVRRYDTRAARRPVANWTQFKSVQKVQRGCSEHEILVSDTQSGLYSVDTRTGKIMTGYKGISGAINSFAPIQSTSLNSGSCFASVALDRFFRLHLAYPFPASPSDKPVVEKRSDNDKTPLKIFVKSTPTAVVWDGVASSIGEGEHRFGANDGGDDDSEDDGDESEEEDEDWDGMDVVNEDGEDEEEDEDSADEDEDEEPAPVRRKRSQPFV
ncbi:hypothetical protein DL93DRAFT_2152166 [Clavulina sp. PMI_390]|nr:hypothetical protein DL93DRAFT_2152166 [Clavulina sp. PMI_390]